MRIPCSAAYFLEMSGRVLLKVATKDCFEVKRTKNLAFLRLFFYNENGAVRPKTFKCL